ncbi:uncharacterized protein PRCAT00000924001 [Priceomyces carsonii]|uniref:uncharacterized protein n=1 Tax=Priceomyces carsonii TaxID=28549 RepID=UPI002ED7A005|nr:unnamed protein product [Priceomyces carsonii]
MSESDAEILELIEQGSFSYAQQLLSRKLKKFPARSYYHALNNHLAYSRGAVREALKANTELLQKVPSDPDTLRLLNEFFTKVGYEKEANLVYENAIKKYPSSQLILEWFKNSINKFDLKLYQRILMLLQKHEKSNRSFAFWAAIGCYTLANHLESEQGKPQLFTSLGIKLLEGLLPSTNDQELFVQVKLMEQAGDEKGIKDLIEQFLNSKTINLDLQLIYLDCLENLQSWEALYNHSKELILVKNFNDFDTWKLLIRSSKEIGKQFSEIEPIIHSSTVSRNASLSLIELCLAYDQNLFPYVQSYYLKFRGKVCCFNDLKIYSLKFDKDEVLSFITTNLIEDSNNPLSELINQVNIQKFSYFLSDMTDLQGFVSKNWNIYNKYHNLLINKPEFDSYPANELIMMNIVTSLQEKDTVNSVFRAIIVLQKILSVDPNDPRARLLLLKLLSSFSFPSISLYNYEALKIKMVQHDTLGHYIQLTPSVSSLNYLLKIYRFYLTAEQEIHESIIGGFEKGAFTKIEGFCSFGRRIRFSFSKFQLILDILKISKITKSTQYITYFTKIIKDYEFCLLDESLELYDNRDFKTVWKFGLNKEYDLYSINKPKSKEFIHLNLIRQLLIIEGDKAKAAKMIKIFNKFLSNNVLLNQLDAFENWIYKIYLNLFKLTKLEPTKETDSISNFLNKNLKLSKIQSILITDNSLSNTFMSNLSSMIELIGDIKYLTRGTKDSHKNIQALRDHLIKDIKQLDFKSLRLQHLKHIKESLVFQEEESIDKMFIDRCFESFEESLDQFFDVSKFL